MKSVILTLALTIGLQASAASFFNPAQPVVRMVTSGNENSGGEATVFTLMDDGTVEARAGLEAGSQVVVIRGHFVNKAQQEALLKMRVLQILLQGHKAEIELSKSASCQDKSRKDYYIYNTEKGTYSRVAVSEGCSQYGPNDKWMGNASLNLIAGFDALLDSVRK